MTDVITKEYNGIIYSYTPEAANDLKLYYNLDIESEIERGIDLELNGITVETVIENNSAKIIVKK